MTALSEDDCTKASKTKGKHGGRRDNQTGRPTVYKGKTQAIRARVEIIPLIKELNARLAENSLSADEIKKLNQENNAINLSDAEIARLSKANLALVEQRDREHLQVVKLQNELMTAKTNPAKLRKELSELKRQLNQQKTRFCQCLTAAGYQCTRPATHENKHNGFILWTCEQHYQAVINTTLNSNVITS